METKAKMSPIAAIHMVAVTHSRTYLVFTQQGSPRLPSPSPFLTVLFLCLPPLLACASNLCSGNSLNASLRVLEGVRAAHPARRGPGPGLDPPRWGDHVRGSQSNGGRGSADSHRSAGGRYEGIGPPGHQLAPNQRQEIPAHKQ